MRSGVRLTAIFLFCLAFIFSCQPDEQQQPTNPSDARDNLTGFWSVEENSTTYGVQHYDVEILKDASNAANIKVDNFFGMGDGKVIIGTLNSLNLTIPSQTVDNTIFQGTGTIQSDYKKISLNYTFNEGNGNESVSSIYTKKP